MKDKETQRQRDHRDLKEIERHRDLEEKERSVVYLSASFASY